MMNKYLILLLAIAHFSCTGTEEKPAYLKITGITMGVIPYSVTYLDSKQTNYQVGIDSLLSAFNQSLSTYVGTSEISTLNQTSELTYRSDFFYPVLEASREVYDITSGAYDPTVGPLVNLWGFGPGKNKVVPDSSVVLDVLKSIGFNKIVFDQTKASAEKGVQLDFSAIAKGYAVDLVADYLAGNGVKNYFVEIGGEVISKGLNPSQKIWQIGIYDPRVAQDPSKERAAIAIVKDQAVATSGNYRNYYEADGKKYGHTISPFTGFPVQHSLLSVSVFTENCMLADAYATAFMVLGLNQSIAIVEANQVLEGHFIYADEKGEIRSYTTQGLKKSIILEEL